MSRHNLGWLLGIFSVSVFGFFVSYASTARESDRDYEHVRLFVDVLHKVRSQYVHELTPERERKLVEDMLNGGLDRLDPHSGYISKKEYKQFTRQSKGKFGGVGIHLGYDPATLNQLTVISPMVGTPAHDAGILAGDVILKIDGKSTEGMRLSEAVDLIQGEPGEKVILNVRHESGDTQDIPIVRAEIKVPSVLGDVRKPKRPKEWDFIVDRENRIGYVRLTGFTETSAGEIRDALNQLKKEGMRGLVLDLRGNPGGLLKSAKEISNLFLSEGRIVSTKGRNQDEEIYTADPHETMLGPESNVPMAILINRYSASASEIVSACLQDHKRAVIVGERSYGKGSVQNIIPMEHGQSALKLTTASYWRPSGKNIHRFPDSKESDEWGVKPDAGMEVTLTREERIEYARWRNDRDIVREEKPAPKKDTEKEKEKDKGKDKDKDKKVFVDKVLEKALQHLRKEIKKAARDIVPETSRA
ncbi:MAG TPA: S41 family peptidase [Gemmataceae bacterium]|nr:S41 family peptidase [Gemmataceae bacterium]